MKLGERFIKKNLSNVEQIKKALLLQQHTGGRLGDILLSVNNIRSMDYYQALAEHHGLLFLDLLDNIPPQELLLEKDRDIYVSQLTVPVKKENEIYTVATANPSEEVIDFIKKYWGESTHIVCTAKFDILYTLQNRFHKNYLHDSVNQLIEKNIAFSAKYTFSIWQKIFILLILSAGLSLLIFMPSLFFIIFNVTLTVFIFLILGYKIILSCVALFIDRKKQKFDISSLPKKALPIYTILIPLFKENEVTLSNLFSHLQKLKYPKHKLDIKILLEEDDKSTIAILKKMNLPHYFEFVYIPVGLPRTKAKACNYGLRFSRGEYLTLYDAEDKPDPYQLKKALSVFLKDKTNKLACVQGRLNFYNKNENWLTRMFTIEYTYWFDLLLPALSFCKLPIPLGGTSNHFKTSVLKEIDAWDPYNVAEDADIGIRLERLGYTITVMNSTTYEEANCRLLNWIKQRTRWIKGYMQTYVVHMRNPIKLWCALGTRGFLGFQLFVGGTIISNLCYLFVWILFLVSLVLTPEENAYFFPKTMTYFSYFNFIGGSMGIILLNFLGILRRRLYSLALFSITSPFYWLLISMASYRALYQLFFNPSYWDKTEHGISKTLKSSKIS